MVGPDRDYEIRLEHWAFFHQVDLASVIARLDRAIQYPPAGGYWIARSSRAMTAQRQVDPMENARTRIIVAIQSQTILN
jgi:hypothetical protein